MKRLNEFTNSEVLSIILANKSLARMFEEYIYEGEMDYIQDKLNCFPRNCMDYCISTYDYNYMKVKDSSAYLDGVQKCVRCFGCTERLDSLMKHCYALKHSNLFDYMVSKLAEVFYQEEIKGTMDYLEECSYAIYCRDTKDYLIDCVECFVDCRCDNAYVNDDNKLIQFVSLS